MSEDDLKINSRVRKILVENNLDLSSLGVSTASGSVMIRGELKKMTGHEMNDREVTRALIVLETVILRSKGVKRVLFTIPHWKKSKGKWLKQEK
jgi:formylmethanofuran dehydrogenase subunit C